GKQTAEDRRYAMVNGDLLPVQPFGETIDSPGAERKQTKASAGQQRREEMSRRSGGAARGQQCETIFAGTGDQFAIHARMVQNVAMSLPDALRSSGRARSVHQPGASIWFHGRSAPGRT